MQAADLLYPGYTGPNERIRRDVAFAISKLETAKGLGAPDKPAFALFLADAATKTPGYAGPIIPATQALVSDGVKVNAVSVTGTGNFATFTVAGGVITGIVLSAS